MSEEAVVRQRTVKGATYRGRLRIHNPCPDSGVDLTTGLVAVHRRRMHGTEPDIYWKWLPVSQTEHISQIFDVILPKGTSHFPCTFPGCPGSSCTCNGLRNHFNLHNWGGSIRILDQHPTLFHKCDRCGSQVPPWRLRKWHFYFDKFRLVQELRIRQNNCNIALVPARCLLI